MINVFLNLYFCMYIHKEVSEHEFNKILLTYASLSDIRHYRKLMQE